MFKRDLYLKELIDKKQNHLVKVITGIRRSGKSYLLNTIFYNYLVKEENVPDDHIIRFAFDNDEDIFLLDKYLMDQPTIIEKNNQKLVNSRKFLCYIKDLVRDNDPYYFLLDEIQNLDEFVRTLNAFLRHENYDVYVTGSNSRFLSSEVDTEFGGRGDRIHLLPLTFSEFLNGTDYDANTGLKMYERYGGIPLIQLQKNDTEKAKQTISILNETYIKDVKDRHPNVNVNNLNDTFSNILGIFSLLTILHSSTFKTSLPQ